MAEGMVKTPVAKMTITILVSNKNNHRKKLTLEKDDGSLNPSDGSKIDNPITLLEDFAVINSLLSSQLNAPTAEHAR